MTQTFTGEPMQAYQKKFIQLALDYQVLKFGEFTLKSGRKSPYFFNAGMFNSGRALAQLGSAYAEAIVASGMVFDVLFGPAYKGIPLAAVTAAALFEKHGLDIPYAFNRKEAKDHGEGGVIVGHPLEGRVLVIDDVITAGTAIRESIQLIDANDATAVGVVIALDRQEKGQGELSAVQEIHEHYGLDVSSIVRLNELIQYLEQEGDQANLQAMQAYRQQFGINPESA